MSGVNIALLVLALAWVYVLVPPAVRSWQTSPQATVGGFERAMRLLGSGGGRDDRPASPEPSSVRRREDPVIVLRRTRFVRLLVLTGVMLAGAIVLGGLAWVLFALALIATIAYVVVLRRLKVQRDEARDVVRELHLHPPDAQHRDHDDLELTGVAVGASHTVRLRRWDG
ncbi:MAG: hypothetical protein WD011_05600 [Nitriliruptoraceae bacterium]